MLRRIVLIGATGFFGHRLAERLAAIGGVELIATSRSQQRANAIVGELVNSHPNARISAIAFDRDRPADIERLRALSPWLVIDASGPFQSASYDLARATLELGAHWNDLADARDYLLGFEAALDPIAGRKGLVARAGASSTPALSTSVVEDLTRRWQRLDSVDIAVMPGGAGRVGISVIRAILSYAGTTIETYREGARAEGGMGQRTAHVRAGTWRALSFAGCNRRRRAAAGALRRYIASYILRWARVACRTIRSAAPRQTEAARFC